MSASSTARARKPNAPRSPSVAAAPGTSRSGGTSVKTARRSRSVVEGFVGKVRKARPLDLVEIERAGVEGRLLKDLATVLQLPAARFFEVIGIPKATAERKVAAGDQLVAGSAGVAAIGVARLLGIAQSMLHESTADEAKGFDAGRWLGRWLEQPQPALGGKKPSELLDTPTGIDIVARVLGAIGS